MIPPITNDLLLNAILNERMLEAGRAYYLQGRVSSLEAEFEIGMASAIVRGSGQNRYFTSVIFEDEDYDGVMSSECSCPIGEECKHVAALLFALRDEAGDAGRGAAIKKPRLRIEFEAERAPVLSGPVGDWLNSVTLDALAATVTTEPLVFVIEPERLFKQTRAGLKNAPGVTLPDRRTLKIVARRWSNENRNWRIAYTWEIDRMGLRVEPVALRLLARMALTTSGGDFAAGSVPHGRPGWQWLCEATQAGLLRWKAPDSPPVTICEANLVVRLNWRKMEDGRQAVELDPAEPGRDLDALTIFGADPPVYYDPDRGELGLIDGGAPAVVGRLLKMPPVAPAEIAALAPRWTEIAGDALSPPALPTAGRTVAAAPRPVLRFMVEKIRRPAGPWGYRGYSRTEAVEIARLEFDYAGQRIDARQSARKVIVSTPEGMVVHLRDSVVEQSAVDRLAGTTLLPIVFAGPFEATPIQGWDHVLLDWENGDELLEPFPQFLINDAEKLRSEGWIIEYAPKWPHIYLSPDDAGAENLQLAVVRDEDRGSRTRTGKIDWFDVELAALVGGQRIDILPALRRLLATTGSTILGEDDAHRVPLMLGNGRFTAMPLGALRPLLESLLRLALMDREPTTLRLNPFDLGVIHELAGTGLPWTSEDRLRTLASALHGKAEGYVPPAGLSAQLRPYQQDGCAWMQALKGAGMGGILADDMGLGKTLQAIAHILSVREMGPVLIVAPTSVLPNWQAELARFAPELECLLWHGPARHAAMGDQLPQAEVVLTSYPLLARDIALLSERPWALAVLDEAHGLKNPKTAGFKAAAALKADQVMALTGTPIENRLTDVWALASLTNPGLLGSFEAFRKTWRNSIEKHDDPQAKAALARRLRPFMLRRTKDEVAQDLPPKTVISERIDLSDAQLRLYESQRLLMQTRIREEIDRVGLKRSQIVVLDAMLKLRQICCDPALLPRDAGKGIASAKRARLLEMLGELVDEGRRVIVFSQFTTMLDRIAADLDAAGVTYEQLRGATKDRAHPVRRFQEGEVPVILVSLKAGGAGVNLTAADTVILYDPWWNPAVEAQAIDRAHRIGQDKPIFVHRLIAIGTIEEKILSLQDRKQGLADVLWSQEAQAGGPGLDDEDIAFLLGRVG
jgi:superfamily II DNA or RNA helicase